MANYQSIPARFNKAKSRINHQYIDSVLKDKQNTIDTNFGLMQQSVEKVLGQDFANPEDAEMLKNKVSGVLNALGKTDSIKFDSKKSRFFMQDALSQAAKDPEVLKEVANTKRIRQMQDFYSTRSKKGNLNSKNFNDALIQMGYNDYMKTGKERKKDLGSFNYKEHEDVFGDVLKEVKTIQELYPEREIAIEDKSTGNIEYFKAGNATAAQIQKWMPSLFTASRRAQLEIDGASMYGYDDVKAQTDLSINKDNLLQPNIDLIESKKASLLGASGNNRKKIEAEISKLQNINKRISNNFDNIGASSRKIGAYLLQQQLTNNVVSSFGTDNSLPFKIDRNSAYYKAKQEAKKLTAGLLEPKGTPDFNKNNVADIAVIGTPKELLEKDTIDPFKVYKKQIQDTENEISAITGNIFNNIKDEKVKTEIEQFKQTKIQEYLKQGMDPNSVEAEAFKSTIVEYVGSEKLSGTTLNQKNELLKKLEDVQGKYSKISNAVSKTEQDIIDLSSETIFKETTQNDPNIEIIGLEGRTTFKQFFNKRGIKSGVEFRNYLNNGTEESKIIKANILLSKLDGMSRGGLNENAATFFDSEDDKLLLSNVAKLLGDNSEQMLKELEGLNETFLDDSPIANLPMPGQVPLGEMQRQIRKGLRKGLPNRYKTLNILQTLYSERSKIGLDNRLYQDNAIMDKMGSGSYKNVLDRNLSLQEGYVPGINMMNIEEGTPFWKEINNLIPIELKKGAKVSVIQTPEGGLRVFQSTSYTKTFSDDQETVYTPIAADIQANDLQQTQYLKYYIDLQVKNDNVKFNVNKEADSGPINFQNTVDFNKQLIDFYKNPKTVLQASKDYALKKYEGDTKFINFANKIYNNSNLFSTKYKSVDGSSRVSLFIEGEEEALHSVSTSDPVIGENIAKINRVTPQLFINQMIDKIYQERNLYSNGNYPENSVTSKVNRKINNNAR